MANLAEILSSPEALEQAADEVGRMSAKGRAASRVYSYSLQEYFSEQVTRIANLLTRDHELKEGLLEAAHELAKTLNVVSDNSIQLPEDVITRTRDTLRWLEECLDGKKQGFMLDETQYRTLDKIYQDSSEALGVIALQSALLSLK